MKFILLLIFLVSTASATSLHFDFDFNNGRQGWQTAFADYPKGQEDFFELESEIRALPAEISPVRKGLFVSGNNHSDDLYMFLSRAFGRSEGIVPGKLYKVHLKVTFASNAPTGCLGTGGAPGEGVGLSFNALSLMPKTFVDDAGDVRTRFSHGQPISDIANGIPCEESQGQFVSLTKTSPVVSVRSGKDGKIWIVLGTDSGFESTTALFYEKVEVFLQ